METSVLKQPLIDSALIYNDIEYVFHAKGQQIIWMLSVFKDHCKSILTTFGTKADSYLL